MAERRYCPECRKHKYCFTTFTEAKLVAGLHSDIKLYPYLCECCGYIHLTHNPPSPWYHGKTLLESIGIKEVGKIDLPEKKPVALTEEARKERYGLYNSYKGRIRGFMCRLEKGGKKIKISSMTKLVNSWIQERNLLGDTEREELQGYLEELIDLVINNRKKDYETQSSVEKSI